MTEADGSGVIGGGLRLSARHAQASPEHVGSVGGGNDRDEHLRPVYVTGRYRAVWGGKWARPGLPETPWNLVRLNLWRFGARIA
jgi:hypothetical protein